MIELDVYSQRALEHIRYLSETIGGRGSCTPAERRAGEYVSDQLRQIGLSEIRSETFQAIPSTYRPYILALSSALLGILLAWILDSRAAFTLGAILCALGAWAMFRETEFSPNWTRRLLPKAESQNVIGIISPHGEVHQHAVLCAHIDTHRTPIFYSSKTWHSLFGLLVAAAFASMVVGAIVYVLGFSFDWVWIRWTGLALAPMIVFALGMSLHADFTPFSPGANDNASGVGVVLGLAQRLSVEPLYRTEVWLVFTGCEEVSSYGIQAFLDSHANQLGEDAIYLILDEVGIGTPKYLTSDGLILKRRTHPQALQLARRVSSNLPDIEIIEEVGIAYTDALSATKRGLISLSIGSTPDPLKGEFPHWHQMSDTWDTITLKTLAQVHSFTWQLLKDIDELE